MRCQVVISQGDLFAARCVYAITRCGHAGKDAAFSGRTSARAVEWGRRMPDAAREQRAARWVRFVAARRRVAVPARKPALVQQAAVCWRMIASRKKPPSAWKIAFARPLAAVVSRHWRMSLNRSATGDSLAAPRRLGSAASARCDAPAALAAPAWPTRRPCPFSTRRRRRLWRRRPR